MSTPVFVDPEISTQADGAQSSRVPVPLPEDPYEAIRQAYLVGTDTESEPFEDPVETEAPESPHTVASPTSLPDSTPPTLVPILRRTARMAVRVPPAMSPGLSASMAEVAAMSDSAFRKRFRSSYESSPSSSPPDLPLRKRYQGTSELVEDDDKEGDDEEEDEEMEESSDSDSMSEDAEDEGPTEEDEDPATGDEGLVVGDEAPDMEVESLSLGKDEAIPEGQHRAAPVVETAVGGPLGLGYGALRRQEIALGEGRMPSLFETPPSPEWSPGSLVISPAPSVVPLPISSPMISLTVPSHIASPATAETEGFLTELGAQVEMSGAVRDEIFSKRYRFRSLDHEQERVIVTFEAIWRPVLPLESWAGQTDAQRVALWHAISDTQGENRELQLQLAEERRARLELAEVVDSIRKGQEPRGDV
ncbi:hypothetical protein Tco_0959207 [Tanacetum coccineum]